MKILGAVDNWVVEVKFPEKHTRVFAVFSKQVQTKCVKIRKVESVQLTECVNVEARCSPSLYGSSIFLVVMEISLNLLVLEKNVFNEIFFLIKDTKVTKKTRIL